MSIAFLPVREATPRYAVFGKLPHRADFVRVDAVAPVVIEFDELLGKSLARAHARTAQPEMSAPGVGVSDFQITSRDGRWCLTGVFVPSRDEAGRIYPLVAGIVLPAQAIAPYAPELIIANELFYSGLAEQLASSVENAVDLVACCQFLETWVAPNPHVGDDIELASRILARHMTQTSAADWHDTIFDAGMGGLDDRMLDFVFHARASCGRHAPVLLPLSGAPGEDRLDEAAWLALLRAAMGIGRAPDFILARHAGKCHLAVPAGRIDEKFLAAVLWGAVPDEPETPNESLRPQPPERTATAFDLARQLQDPTHTLASLETTLARLAREANPVRAFSFAH